MGSCSRRLPLPVGRHHERQPLLDRPWRRAGRPLVGINHSLGGARLVLVGSSRVGRGLQRPNRRPNRLLRALGHCSQWRASPFFLLDLVGCSGCRAAVRAKRRPGVHDGPLPPA